MPYDSESGLYERRSTTVIDASPDGDTVYVAIDAKLDLAADDTVIDLNHHAENGNHYPATSVASDSRFFRQSPAGTVSWAVGIPAADAALKDMSNVASGAVAPAKVAQDASNRFFTDTERTKLEGIETGAQVNVAPSKAQVEAVLTGSISTHTHADASTSAKGLIEIATDGEVQAGTDAERAVTAAGLKAAQIRLATVQSASGTGVEFTGIPSWAKRITVILQGVSTNGSSNLLVQLGTSGGLKTSGYTASASSGASGVATTSATAGFNVRIGSSSDVVTGAMILNKTANNDWQSAHACGGNLFFVGGGSVSLAAALDRVYVTTVNGSDTLDAGTINISWE